MKISKKTFLLPLVPFFLFGSIAAAARADALLAGSPQEVRIGPVRFNEKIDSTAVDLNLSLFGDFRVQNGTLRSTARLVIDLSSLQTRAGDLLKNLKLPNEECGLRVSIHRVSLQPESDSALVAVDGEAEVWFCQELPFGQRLITKVLTQGFTVEIAARLAVKNGGRTLALNLADPYVELDGLAGSLDASELGRPLFQALRAGIQSKLEIDPIPQELGPYNPSIQSATFFSNGGRLAVQAVVELAANSPTLTALAQHLADQRR